eukprot:CAMPEP_0170459666 /NCGR_PEP_ID=MMETSP0123-20130129/6277_1 /TAXON_ID=182087 /ORGANISM="Favella ehrenbergii, Strain Fehren 1" /LENGTH=30 /DNA_ID= /DNA_START= /DNA_END= /DNA_ORIENTATION=
MKRKRLRQVGSSPKRADRYTKGFSVITDMI